ADRLLEEEDAAAAAAFYEEDAHARAAGVSIRQLEEELAARCAGLAAAGRPPAIEVLCPLFGLNGVERDLLLLCVAAELDSAFGRLYAYVQDDVTLRHVTVQLATALLCRAPSEYRQARRCLMPEAPLRRYQLVQYSGSGPAAIRAITIDD